MPGNGSGLPSPRPSPKGREGQRPAVGAAIFATAAVWVLVEVLRSVVPILYFPWLLLGHSLLYNAPMRQAADLLGAYGLSFLIAATNAWLAFGLPAFFPANWPGATPSARPTGWRTGWIIFALVAGAYFYGLERIERLTPRLKPGATIAVVQGNIKTKLGRSMDDLTRQMIRHVELHREVIEKVKAAEGKPPALVCWAETMVPGNMNQDSSGEVFLNEIKKSGVPALTGSNYIEPGDETLPLEKQRIHNTAFIYDAEGHELLRYYKRRLVAFGEYIPYAREYAILAFVRSVTQDQYVPGDSPSPVVDVSGYHVSLNLCVEDIHPQPGARGGVRRRGYAFESDQRRLVLWHSRAARAFASRGVARHRSAPPTAAHHEYRLHNCRRSARQSGTCRAAGN